MAALPRSACFRSAENGKYLKCISNDDKAMPNHLQYGSDELLSTTTVFTLEPAASTEKNLVNIRSKYNNKYWRAESSSSGWIVAAASQPNEDQSDPSCTLFEPVYDSNKDGYRIMHANRGQNLILYNNDANRPNFLFISDSTSANIHAIIDWESLVILPKYILLKGNNGFYLKDHPKDNHEYLKYFSSDSGESGVAHEVFSLSDGNIRLKSQYWTNFGKLALIGFGLPQLTPAVTIDLPCLHL